ncbi:metallophosphoesterase family protein [Azospirillum sp.]|uniref:metallophosphoesterase family protein n=1 Tax=Azospirillum sp. TaxID=34012 RepID=UPI002D2DD679|nr:metallophosphoesterase family protein [Azospirillum sp.]HYD69840.1 metallophosphoesterase family protein [Azospirillum sp.]
MRSFLRSIFGSLGGGAMGGRAGGAAGGNAPAAAPDGLCLYAIGDVHGERRCLERLLAVIDRDAGQRREEEGLQPLLVFLGDYVDRGPDSRGVLDLLCARAAAAAGTGPACRFLLGNHEAAMLDFLREPAAGAEWLNYGGAEALASYGVRASVGIADAARCRALRDALEERLPEEHRAFLESLEPMAVLGDYAFVHAGVRPGVPLERQRLEDLLWIREPFLSSPRSHGKVVVHGHTVLDEPQVLPNRIGLDTGAYATGVLSAVALHGTHRRILQARV